MKKIKLVLIIALCISAIMLVSFTFRRTKPVMKKKIAFVPPGCVFRTVMGEESSDSNFVYKTPQRVLSSLDHGLSWMLAAQNANGGWGAGSHYNQKMMDPHAVETDPATTSMVAMALVRTGTSLEKGPYHASLKRALNYLLESVENSKSEDLNITTLTGTQIQTKLGANIDVILTAQFLSNIVDETAYDPSLHSRVKKALDACVSKIQKAQNNDGSIAGSGWAGVLQSSFATNALEAAQSKGATVDDKSLERSRDFQKTNFDAKTGDVKTDMGAGVVLYSVTGSARASAKEARKVKEDLELAQKNGTLPQAAPATPENLEKIGYAKDKALKMSTSYEVYEAAKNQAQQEDIMSGFGNNGGEEFLSYLQTGESMIIGKDVSWKKWYDNVSGRLLKIQNNDGSWNGHHCITSPVFCTATCLLILSVNNDIDRLIAQGVSK